MSPCLLHEFVGQSLYIVGTCPRIDDLGDVGFLLDVDLGVTGDTSRKVGRQCDSLVEGVGVQRLGMTLGGSHSLDTSAAHVVEGILGGQ